MSKFRRINADDPAFPCQIKDEEDGLTKRELFAALAMHAIVSGKQVEVDIEDVGIAACEMADNLIDALNGISQPKKS